MNLHITLRSFAPLMLALGLTACATPTLPLTPTLLPTEIPLPKSTATLISTRTPTPLTYTPEPTAPPILSTCSPAPLTALSSTVVRPTTTAMARQTASAPASTDSGEVALQKLMSYVPLPWRTYHGDQIGSESGDDLVGPLVYYLDLAHIRSDLNLPPVSETLTSAQRPQLVEAFNSLGFDLSKLNLADADFAAQWGWDLTNVSQLLRFTSSFDNTEAFALLGNFDGAQIEQCLTRRGYKATSRQKLGTPSVTYKRFQSTQPGQPVVFLSDNALLIGTDFAELEVAMAIRGGRQYDDPYLQSLLAQSSEAWSIIMAPGGAPAAWELMAMAYNGAQPSANLAFAYRYPSAAEAQRDISLVKERVANAVSAGTGQPWTRMITIDAVQATDQVLTAQGSTSQIDAIHSAFQKGDVGFLPFRTETTIETVREDGWTLYQKPAKHFAISLPPGWKSLTLTKQSFAEFTAGLAQHDAQAADTFAKVLQDFLQVGGDFFAFDLLPSGRIHAYMTVLEFVDNSTPCAAQDLGKSADNMFGGLEKRTGVFAPVERERVSLPAGQAERVTYAHRVSGQSAAGRTVHYLLVNGCSLYVINFYLPEDTKESLALVDQMAKNFQLLK